VIAVLMVIHGMLWRCGGGLRPVPINLENGYAWAGRGDREKYRSRNTVGSAAARSNEAGRIRIAVVSAISLSGIAIMHRASAPKVEVKLQHRAADGAASAP